MTLKMTTWLIRRRGINQANGQFVEWMPIGIVEGRSRFDAVRAAERRQFKFRIANVITYQANQFCHPVPISKAPKREWDFVLTMDEMRQQFKDEDLCAFYWRDWYQNQKAKRKPAVWRGLWEEKKWPGVRE